MEVAYLAAPKGRKVNLCFVNTTDLIGGAERCSFDLHRALRARGHKSSLIVGRRLSDDPDVHPLQYASIESKAWTVLRNGLGLTETLLLTPFRAIRRHEFRSADVVNIHNMHGCYWNFWTVPVLARSKPVVLTLHDEFLLTGDCVYTYDCDRWMRSCGSCPQLANEIRPVLGGHDLTRVNLSLKRAAMTVSRADHVQIVTPSQWLADRAAKTVLRRFPITVIPNGVDLSVFRPNDRRKSRAILGLPQDQFCFLFFAANLHDPRKGAERLATTVQQFGLPAGSLLVLVGNGSDELRRRLPGVSVMSVGYVAESEKIADLLSAVDCMLLLSEADNLPYTAIEAAACGCPVIAIDVGGIPEEVTDNGNGRLLKRKSSPQDLAAVMQEFVSMDAGQRAKMGQIGRERAEWRFSISTFAGNYEKLFQSLADQQRSRETKGGPSVPNRDRFEEEIVQYAAQPENQESFARLLKRILPAYTQWTWGKDSIYRRHFNSWQSSGFNLAPNHYYCPMPDTRQLSAGDLNRTFSMRGVEMREGAQLELLADFAQFRPEYERFSETSTNPQGFHYRNGVFESCDAEVLHCMIRRHKPARVIEIGSGYTTLITAAACEANRKRDGVPCEFTAIEPYPNDLFRSDIPGLSQILRSRVQEVDPELFRTLKGNDILFIDSSHVLKTGSDVELLYLEILPALNPGVIIHVHDIFLPGSYPVEWIREEHVFWNEQQLLHGFLLFNNAFQVMWAGSYLHRRHPDELSRVFPAYSPANCLPGSFWMRRNS